MRVPPYAHDREKDLLEVVASYGSEVHVDGPASYCDRDRIVDVLADAQLARDHIRVSHRHDPDGYARPCVPQTFDRFPNRPVPPDHDQPVDEFVAGTCLGRHGDRATAIAGGESFHDVAGVQQSRLCAARDLFPP